MNASLQWTSDIRSETVWDELRQQPISPATSAEEDTTTPESWNNLSTLTIPSQKASESVNGNGVQAPTAEDYGALTLDSERWPKFGG
ncbi:MAG: hypothetical protein Q9218_005979 [Villophora microphyllina]